jgi:predicted DNA-binding transcriptional regulator YafY
LALNTKINSKKLYQRLNISRDNIFRDLDKLKDTGVPISYCYNTKIYFFTADFELTLEEMMDKH